MTAPFKRLALTPPVTAELRLVPGTLTGFTFASVKLGGLPALRATLLDSAGLAELTAEVDRYNADPAGSWAQLLRQKATAEAGTRAAESLHEFEVSFEAVTMADESLPFDILGTSLPFTEKLEPYLNASILRAGVTVRPGTSTVSIAVTAIPADGEPVLLARVTGDSELLKTLDAEVERFNEDPTRNFRHILRGRLRERALFLGRATREELEAYAEAARMLSALPGA